MLAPTLRPMRGLILDVAAFGGFGAFLYGVHQLNASAAWIVGGGLVCVGALLALRSKS